MLSSRGHAYFLLAHDVPSAQIPTVEFAIRTVVLAQRGALQRDAGEQTTRTRIGEDLGLHDNVRLGRGGATLGARCRRGVRTELHLAAEDRVCPFGIHHQENEVRSLPPNLETDIDTFEGEHCRRTPRPGELRPRAASDGSPAKAAADSKG